MAGAATVLIQLSPLHILLDSVKCTFTVIMPCINQRPFRARNTGTGKDMQKKRLKPSRRETQRDWSDRLSSRQEFHEHKFVQETRVFYAVTPPGNKCWAFFCFSPGEKWIGGLWNEQERPLWSCPTRHHMRCETSVLNLIGLQLMIFLLLTRQRCNFHICESMLST